VTLVTLAHKVQQDLLDQLAQLEPQDQLDPQEPLVQLEQQDLLERLQRSRSQWTTRLPITPWLVEMPSS
jgi:hypothetical protein